MRELDARDLRGHVTATAETISVRLWRLTALAQRVPSATAVQIAATAADIAGLASAATSELARPRADTVDELTGLYSARRLQERALTMLDDVEDRALRACLAAAPAQQPHPSRDAAPAPSHARQPEPPAPLPLPPPTPAQSRPLAQTPPRPMPPAETPRGNERRPPPERRPAVSAKPAKPAEPEGAASRAGDARVARPAWSLADAVAFARPIASLSGRATIALGFVAAAGVAGAIAVREMPPWSDLRPKVPAAAAVIAPQERRPEPASRAETVADDAAPVYAAILFTSADSRAVSVSFNDLRLAHPDLLANVVPKVQTVAGSGSSRAFRLAAYPLRTKEQALGLCEALRARGVGGCQVRRM